MNIQEWMAIIAVGLAGGGLLYKILDTIFSSKITIVGEKIKGSVDVLGTKVDGLKENVEKLTTAQSITSDRVTALMMRKKPNGRK